MSETAFTQQDRLRLTEIMANKRFTDRARKIMALANEEAVRLNHEYIGTEHLLLGLCREGSGVGANALKNLGIDLRTVRLEVEKLIHNGPDKVTTAKVPQTPRAKKVIEYAIEEARTLDHRYVGSEHLLLGLLRENDGVAANVLFNFGCTLELARAEVVNLIGGTSSCSPTLVAEGGVFKVIWENGTETVIAKMPERQTVNVSGGVSCRGGTISLNGSGGSVTLTVAPRNRFAETIAFLLARKDEWIQAGDYERAAEYRDAAATLKELGEQK